MLQTTNRIHDKELYDKVTPQSLLAWHRVRVANMMAKSGRQWFHAVREYNSGNINVICNMRYLYEPASVASG